MESAKPVDCELSVDEFNHCIVARSAGGETVRHGRKGSGPGEFHYPRSVLVLGSTAYVVDSWNHRVQVFEIPSWKYQFAFGEFGKGPGQFFCPSSITFLDPWLIVADTNNARMTFHDRDGRYRFSAGTSGDGFPANVRAASGRIEVQYESGEWCRLEFV